MYIRVDMNEIEYIYSCVRLTYTLQLYAVQLTSAVPCTCGCAITIISNLSVVTAVQGSSIPTRANLHARSRPWSSAERAQQGGCMVPRLGEAQLAYAVRDSVLSRQSSTSPVHNASGHWDTRHRSPASPAFPHVSLVPPFIHSA